MSKSKQIFRQWLPLAMVPMMSVAVLQGCSSDDDPVATDPIIGDSDNSGIPDAFEASTTLGTDANDDGIDDIYALTATGTDTNNNDVDDSYEAILTGGADTNEDGIDDAAAATLAGGGGGTGGGGGDLIPGDRDGSGVADAFEAQYSGGADTNGDGIDDRYAVTATGADTNGNNIDDSFEALLTGGTDANQDGVDDAAAAAIAVNGGTETGSLGSLNIGDNQGRVNLSWNGSVLSGMVLAADGSGATSAALYQGISASNDPGIQLLELNGNAPTFSFPNGLSTDQAAPVAAAMASGNLFIVLETPGGQLRSEQMLPPGGAVVPTYTNLTSTTGAFSNGAGFLNINTNTGDYAAYLNVNLDGSDVDNAGDPISVSAAHIHRDSIAGTVMVELTDAGNSITFKATGQLDQADLQTITSNNGWFNVHQNDGTTPGASFISGHIQMP